MKKIKYSVIVPVFNEEKSLEELSRRLGKVLKKLNKPWEIIFIDDGSLDHSFAVLQNLIKKERQIKAVRLRKNSGKSLAYNIGFALSQGEVIFTLDADLQDQPEEIPKLLTKLEQGADFVSGWKVKREDFWFKVLASRIFNRLTSWLTGVKLHDIDNGFRAFKKETVLNIKLYGDLYRFLPALVSWEGFKINEVEVKHARRLYGRSKYGPSKFIKGFFDLLTVVFLFRFLKRPLHFFGFVGFLIFSLGFVISLYLTILWFSGEKIGHRPLLTLGVLLIIVGFQFVSTGLLGEMLTHFFSKRDSERLLIEKAGRFNE